MSQGTLTRKHFSTAWRYFKEYIQTTKGKQKAIFLLLAGILSIAFICYLNILFSYWTTNFWGAITVKDLPVFLDCLQSFVFLTSAWIIASIARNFFIESFSIGWREWLTQKFLTQYTQVEQDNYLDIARMSEQLDNPQQRIQGDIKSFVGLSCWLTSDLLSSVLRLTTFLGSLWYIGGALSFQCFGYAIWIPGYLVWSALLFSGIASIVTQKIGRSMQRLTTKQERSEADFRKQMELIANESESIAVEKGEDFYLKSLFSKLAIMVSNLYQKMLVRLKVISFQSFYKQVADIFPYVVATPLYFMGKMEMGDLMQISYSFGEVNGALNWFVESFEKLADYQSSLSRISELEAVLLSQKLSYQPKDIHQISSPSQDILIKNLCITQPHTPSILMQGLNLTLKKGEDVVIRGDSGLGKSTLFKVLAGTWHHGSGDIQIPNHRFFFMAQKPSIPHDVTLRTILAYPGQSEDYQSSQFECVLKMVGLEAFITKLDKPDCQWFRTLSGGQQQRISFARALLHKPDWLFLDEATSSLDPKSETYLYTLLKHMLPDTTLVSIAHRDSVENFHNKVINLYNDIDNARVIYSIRNLDTEAIQLSA